MKRTKIFFVLFLAGLVCFVLYMFQSTGFFRSIENYSEFELVQSLSIVGAEDITISQKDSFAIVSATNREIYPPVEAEKGNLYFIDLTSEEYELKLLEQTALEHFAPHGISILKQDSSYLILAVNHVLNEHSFELFELFDDSLVHRQTIKHSSLISPNDIAFINDSEFIFTNDHKYPSGIMRILEDYGGLAVSNVVYFDGENYSEVAKGLAYANGINYSPEKQQVYVATPRSFEVHVFTFESNRLEKIQSIDIGTGGDNIEIDTRGNLWVGSHPNLLKFTSYAKNKSPYAPSEVIQLILDENGKFKPVMRYLDDGKEISGISVAARYRDLLLLGTVKDDKLLILRDKNL